MLEGFDIGSLIVGLLIVAGVLWVTHWVIVNVVP